MAGDAGWPRPRGDAPGARTLAVRADDLYPQSLTGFLRQSEAVAAHDTLDRLGSIRCPTRVSVGEEDILVPPRFSREIAARIPDAVLRVVPGAAHGYFLERADAFNEIWLGFLAQVG